MAQGSYDYHGLSNHELYGTWLLMISRCHNPNDAYYKWYGARGISVCNRWRFGENDTHGVKLFVSDIIAEIGNRPKGMTLDRINGNGNYKPGNIRWATKKQQQSNTAQTRKVNIPGVGIVSFTEACRYYKIGYEAARYRLNIGWSLADALMLPVIGKSSYREDKQ